MNASAPSTDFGFIHCFVPAARPGAPAVLLLHGTGGNEDDLIPLAQAIAPGSALLSPRGKVLEMGMPRYFRRLAEGVFDIEDLTARTDELAAFVRQAQAGYGVGKLVAIGFSNGANIAWSLLFRHPDLLAGALLMRPVLPFDPPALPDLAGIPVLVLSGSDDPMVSPAQRDRLARVLTTAGADVTAEMIRAGHGLTPQDVARATAWMARLQG